MTRVPFYSYADTFLRERECFERALNGALSSDELIDGPTVRQFEAAIIKYTGCENAIAVGNGTDALVLMLQAAGIEKGDEVIVPAYTFVASATAVVHAGATPVFVDIEPHSYALDTERIESAITSRTRAIMAVHLFCQMAQMDKLARVADRHGLLLLEDSAEGIGMRWRGIHSGVVGHAGVLSFFPTKTLGAFGDGGMLITRDPALASRAREQRRAKSTKRWASLDNLQAALLTERLKQLPGEIERRNALAELYTSRLSVLAPQVETPRLVAAALNPPVFYVYQIQVPRRTAVRMHLERCGIETEVYYPIPLPAQPCFGLSTDLSSFPVAQRYSEGALALPMYPDLTEEQVEFVCVKIKEALECNHGNP